MPWSARREPTDNEQELQTFHIDEDYMDINLPDLDVVSSLAAQRRRACLRIILIAVGVLSVFGLIAGATFAIVQRISNNGGSDDTNPPPSPDTQEPAEPSSQTTIPPTPQSSTSPSTPVSQPSTTPSTTTAPTGAPQAPNGGAAPVFGFTVIDTFPHDRKAFTQGLLYENGLFFESTGLNGRSSVRAVEAQSGQVKKMTSVDSAYFAEGLAAVGGRLYQLTWRKGIGFIYSKGELEPVGNWTYKGEGWGLTANDDQSILYMSDGSSMIRVLDPDTLEEVQRRIEVTDDRTPVKLLNELEFVAGEIWANVWMSDRIARIDPQSGVVNSWVNCTGLLKKEDIPLGHHPDVLNGIAYDHASKSLYVTGKLWPKVYRIEVNEV